MKRLIKISLIFAFAILMVQGCKKDKIPHNSTPLTTEEIEAIINTDSIIDIAADKALASSNPVEALKQVAEKYKNMPEVEQAHFEGEHLAVKYRKGGWVFWLIPEKTTRLDKQQILPELQKIVQKSSEINQTDFPKILYISRHYLDDDEFKELNHEQTKYVSKKKNIKPVFGKEFTTDFIAKGGLKNYDAIFFNTHGFYNTELNKTWLITGEKVARKNFFNDMLNRDPKIAKWGKTLVNTFNEDYYCISEDFFDKTYKTNDFNKNSLVYLGACQSMMDPKLKFAKILKQKGVEKIIGYSNNTLGIVSIYNAFLILDQLIQKNHIKKIIDRMAPLVQVYEIEEGKAIFEPNDLDFSKGILKQEKYRKDEKLKYKTELISYPKETDYSFQFPLQNQINDIISPELVKILVDLKMPIYYGITPPKIEGAYKSQLKLMKTNKSKDFEIGHVFNEQTIKFFDQKGLNIKFMSKGSFSSKSQSAIITGSGKNFTLYMQTKDSDDDDNYILLASIYSGTVENGKIVNPSFGFVCVDDSHNYGNFVKKGVARVFSQVGNEFRPTKWDSYENVSKTQYLPNNILQSVNSAK